MSSPALPRHGTGPAAMPSPRSSRAPHYSGSVDDSMEDFLREFEELANSCGLTNHQKVETVTCYTTSALREFWKSLDGYVALDWRDLKRELLELYAGTSALRRHSEQQLRGFVRASAKSRMRSEADVVHYYRQFIILSKPLLDSQRLTPGARNKFFWRGFHKSDRAEMHTRLIAEHPRQPTDVYFGYLDVFEVARAILGSHDLDTSTESDDSLDEPRGTRSRRSNRIPERRYNQDSRGADPTHRTRKQRCSPSPVERDSHLQCSADRHATPAAYETRVIHLKEPSREEEEREAEDLVKHMRGLSVHEEAYAMLYTRCALRFLSIVQLLPKPLLTQPTRPPAPAASFSMQVPTLPSSTHHPWPVTSIPQSPPQVASNPTSFFPTRARSYDWSFF